MHFHLPKPLHGWREFVGEISIIVLGVLIALGLEQLVQSVHERTIAAEAREAVRAEVSENLWWLERREEVEPCIDRTLTDLAALVARARRGEATPVVHDLGLGMHAKVTSLRWDANSQSGRASLFSGDEQRLLGNMYFSTEEFRRTQDQEEDLWSKMSFVDGVEHLTPDDVHDLGILVAQAQFRNSIAKVSTMRAHQWAQRLHLAAANPNGVENLKPWPQPGCAASGGSWNHR